MTIIDTSSAPTVPARKVEELKPTLLLTQEHHMCPGCGEPLAVRQFLETIDELGVAQRAVAVAGIGWYTSFSRSLDGDLGQGPPRPAPSPPTRRESTPP